MSGRLAAIIVFVLTAGACATTTDNTARLTAFGIGAERQFEHQFYWVDSPEDVTQLFLDVGAGFRDMTGLDESWSSLREIVVRCDDELGPSPAQWQQMLTAFAALPQLESLIFHGLPPESDKLVVAFEPLKNLRQLTRLQFTSWFFDSDATAMAAVFHTMPALTDLSIGFGASGGGSVTPTFLKALGSCTSLRHLRLRLREGTGEDAVPLASLERLEVLHLSGSVQTDFFFDWQSLHTLITSLPMLRTLVLNEVSGIGRGGNAEINAPNLESIKIRGASFDDGTGWYWLLRQPKLRRVHLELLALDSGLVSDLLRAPLDELTLGTIYDAGVGRNSVPHMAYTPGLLPGSRFSGPRGLTILDGFRVEPGFVKRLGKAVSLRCLTVLKVSSGSETSAAIDSLQGSRPTLTIRR